MLENILRANMKFIKYNLSDSVSMQMFIITI